MRINIDIELPAPPTAVWEYVRDIGRHVEWMHDAARIDFTSDQREGAGTTFDCLTKIGPLRTTDRMEITEWVDAEVMGVRHSGMVTGEGRFTLTPANSDTTRFAWDEELHFPIWMGGKVGEVAAKPVLEFVWRRNLKGLRSRLISEMDLGLDMSSRRPGALIGTGRDSEIREFGGDAVIRTSHRGRDLSHEVEVMRHVVAAGYPAPRVLAVPDGNSIVMDRLHGPTMLDDLTARPWRLRRHAKTLAALHLQLRDIPAPQSWQSVGAGNSVVHLDLHPNNVKLTDDGPMVFDWAHASRGSVELDAALTYVILRTGHIVGNTVAKAAVAAFRRRFAQAFLKAAGGAAVLEHLTEAAELRLLDPNLLVAERDAVFALARGELD
ncbi:MAG: tRNA A-37 threonylcarbamoyl transferase component Bud32/carbon monoxide dehydrogenase subunit G [Candidatus Poriferisodalaceae bacterium]|jgi:tRNA A-37 threonylcarbamoyl transferase component Bud32/carbon monoxide dehydrogenase subunit G